MNQPDDRFDVTVVDTLQGLDRIEAEYSDLFERSRSPSVFISFEYVRTSWEKLAADSDLLLVLAIRKQSRLVGVVPFVIELHPMLSGLSLRVIKFITELGIGDRPRALTSEDDTVIWRAVCRFLGHRFRGWDAMTLTEQPANAPVLSDDCWSHARYPRRVFNGPSSLRASLSGSWADYIGSRKGKIRGDLARCRRRLSELPQSLVVECVDDQSEIGAAFDRYLALEQRTWKRQSDLSIGGNPDLEAFNRALFERLAPKGMVALYFLRSGQADAAAAVIFRARDQVYGAHICYAPDFSKFSPGTVLNAAIMERHFSCGYKTFDFLTLENNEVSRQLKENWATETEQLVDFTIFNLGPRYLVYRAERRLLRTWALFNRWRRRA